LENSDRKSPDVPLAMECIYYILQSLSYLATTLVIIHIIGLPGVT